MKTKKLNGFEYSDRVPKVGDVMICIQRKNLSFKHLSIPSASNIKMGIIDTTNWKVVENMEERKQLIVDAVIEQMKEDISGSSDIVRMELNRVGDYTVIDGLLKMLPCHILVDSLPEEEWEKYPEHKHKIV